MDVATISQALETAIAEKTLDPQLFQDFDTLLAIDSQLALEAQNLLPLFTKLATHTTLIDELPSTLIPKILQNATLDHIFSLIPPDVFAAGLDQPSTAPMLVQMLLKTTSKDDVALKLCEKAIDQILDPFCFWPSSIEQLIEVLASQNCCPQIPDQELYESTNSQLQCRLMAINIILLRFKQQPRFLFWDLTVPDLRSDPLLLIAHIIYISDLCELGVDILPQMSVLCPLYISDAPFLCHDIERAFLALLEVQPIKFRELDNKYGLTEKQSVSFLARLPPDYLLNFPELVEELTLTVRLVPVFCNLATCFETYKLLNLTPRSINNLPFDLRAQLVAAATANPQTAHQFVARFPSIMDAIVVPAAHPESAHLQQIIGANLKEHGIRIVAAPEIQTSAG